MAEMESRDENEKGAPPTNEPGESDSLSATTGSRTPAGGNESPEMSFLDHLMELRRRLLISIAALVAAAMLAGTGVPWMLRLLKAPLGGADSRLREVRSATLYDSYERNLAALVDSAAAGIRDNPAERPEIMEGLAKAAANLRREFAVKLVRHTGSEWRTSSPVEPFTLMLKIAVAAGVVLASPVWLFQLWVFLTPGLFRKEKNLLGIVFTAGTTLFLAGTAFAYMFVVPTALDYLINLAAKMDAVTDFDVKYYLNFVLMILLGFGLAFETPLVVAALAKFRLLSPGTLTKHWRWFIVAAFVFGALLTPPDILTQLIMASVLLVMYLLSLGLAFLLYPRKTGDDTRPEH